MAKLSFKRHRFHSEVIQRAVWLDCRFILSLQDVEEILAKRGIDVSYEAIREWCRKFGLQIAMTLKRRRTRRHLISQNTLRAFRTWAHEAWHEAVAS